MIFIGFLYFANTIFHPTEYIITICLGVMALAFVSKVLVAVYDIRSPRLGYSKGQKAA